MKVLITGSSGLIGSELITFFDSRAQRVLALTTTCERTFSVRKGTPDGTNSG